MKHQLYVLSLTLLIISCKENISDKLKPLENNTMSSTIENEDEEIVSNPYQDSDSQKALYKALKKKTPLTGDQLLAILPEHINGNKKYGEHGFQVGNQFANGMYGSANSPYNFWIEDGSGSRAIVRNFLMH
ncbi:hypothetical protein EV196_101139 [Mariniflexile fucanivorans]|uniref:Uncharacterized protein n=1 Tax=Mariniflexile fucanivorans TaxID=264023 RepID=A0A4R1RRQ4_9FLAO|nr:hypothetical protein [Mariniflexile fucanivorans]TCL68720.1 hypothetical protein EV196_101139 [Mariniflexile fucanivorans]